MQIDCPSCAAAYQVPEAALAAGRTVRCARCGTVWFATLSDDARAEAPAMAQGEGVGASFIDDEEYAVVDARRDDREDGALFDAGVRSLGMDAAEGGEAGASPPLVPDMDGASGIDIVEDGPRDRDEAVRAFAARRAARRHAVAHGARFQYFSAGIIITVMVSAFVILLATRVQVVRVMPQMAGLFRLIGMPVNLRGIDFEAISTTKDMHDGVPVFIVEGRMVNAGRLPVDVPRLRFAMRNGNGQEIYAWTAQPTKASLGPNESQSFLTRLASPPAEARDVLVRFYTRRDLLNGLR